MDFTITDANEERDATRAEVCEHFRTMCIELPEGYDRAGLAILGQLGVCLVISGTDVPPMRYCAHHQRWEGILSDFDA